MRHCHYAFRLFFTVSYSCLNVFIIADWKCLVNLSFRHPQRQFLLPTFFFLWMGHSFCFFAWLMTFCWKLNISDVFAAILDTDSPLPFQKLLVYLFNRWLDKLSEVCFPNSVQPLRLLLRKQEQSPWGPGWSLFIGNIQMLASTNC